MKITVSQPEVKVEDKLVVALDVGQKKLNCYSPFVREGQPVVMVDEVENRSNAVRGAFLRYLELAGRVGCTGVHILCEPTGGYEKNLLRIAHELGCSTAYVNGESVAKLRVVVQNDTGKTDDLDPRVIYQAGMQGRQLAVRAMPAPYQQLRTLNTIYEQEDKCCVTAKNCLHDVLLQLFPDLRLSSAKLFGSCGASLVEGFGADPCAIFKAGLKKFEQRMRAKGKYLRKKTLTEIFEAAHLSSLHRVDTEVRAVLAERVRQLYADWEHHQERKAALKEQMTRIYQSLPEYERLGSIPGVSDFWLARLIGETGPLDDYAHPRRLLRMAGLNIRERKSGKYKGQNKISKKGRALLRKILFQIVVLGLLKPGGLYCSWYSQRKLEAEDVVKLKLTTAAMRKFLVAVLGTYRSPMQFTEERLFVCASKFDAA